MSQPRNISVQISVQTRQFAEAMARLSKQIGMTLGPAMARFGQAVAEGLGDIREHWPGMPYTAPSGWWGEQMIADGLDR